MQALLTASIELLFFAFSAIFLLDLAIALKNGWVASALTPQTQLEKKAIAQVRVAAEIRAKWDTM